MFKSNWGFFKNAGVMLAGSAVVWGAIVLFTNLTENEVWIAAISLFFWALFMAALVMWVNGPKESKQNES